MIDVCVCGGGGGEGERERLYVCVDGFIVECPSTLPPSVCLALRANDQVRRFINIHLHYITLIDANHKYVFWFCCCWFYDLIECWYDPKYSFNDAVTIMCVCVCVRARARVCINVCVCLYSLFSLCQRWCLCKPFFLFFVVVAMLIPINPLLLFMCLFFNSAPQDKFHGRHIVGQWIVLILILVLEPFTPCVVLLQASEFKSLTLSYWDYLWVETFHTLNPVRTPSEFKPLTL